MRRARAAGLAAIALTDHDTTAGVPDATSAGAALGVRIVSGCEFSVKAPWGELHLLAYFLPPGHPRLEEFLVGTRAARQRRAEQIVGQLRRLGVSIELAAGFKPNVVCRYISTMASSIAVLTPLTSALS